VLGEFGDDPQRYDGARARKNYAGNARSPGPRARRSSSWPGSCAADALHQQALSALRAAPGARAYYDQLRAGHHAALRQLSNRLVGILHGCLTTHTP
jgi:hypothetical protein